MRKTKVTVSEPIVVAQSTTEPIFKGGYQDPYIRCDTDGTLYVRFHGRMDCPETFGLEEGDPVYCSKDGGNTWERHNDPDAWTKVRRPLPNGDRLQVREHRPILDIPPEVIAAFPPIPESRKSEHGGEYTVEEMEPFFGDRVAKEFIATRVYAGTDEAVEETCKVNWPNMSVEFCNNRILRRFPYDDYKVDRDGVLWLTVSGRHVFENGEGSKRLCMHLLRSDDFGHTWDYVNTAIYEEKYNNPNCRDIEGFYECTTEILDDGSMILIMRSGSLYPFAPKLGDKDHPAPLCYIAKTSDKGKSWDYIKPFYDYGVRPGSVRLDCGTIVFISGRPGVYIRTCDDPKGEEWSDIIPILTVPEEDVYERYWHYTCSNCGVTPYDAHTAFITYSDFTLTAPNGEKAKSILVRRITVEDIE